MQFFSAPTSVSVLPADIVGELPAWVPPAGLAQSYFNNVPRFDTGIADLASRLDPDQYLQDPTFMGPGSLPESPYSSGINAGKRIFTGTGGFYSCWNSQSGGAYAPELGLYGSIILYAGGHNTWDGACMVVFDIEKGIWYLRQVAPYCAIANSITGGTVATMTGTVTTTDSNDESSPIINDRVNVGGMYIKTADGVAIPGTDLDPELCTTIIPYPVHSNAGINVVPAAGGGDPLGTFVMCGHGQTKLPVPDNAHRIFACDLQTMQWRSKRIPINNYNYGTAAHNIPGLEWDSGNNLMWYIDTDGPPWAMRITPTTMDFHKLTNPDLSTWWVPNACYLPSRKLMVTVRQTGANVASNSMNSNGDFVALSITRGTPIADRHRVIDVGCTLTSGNRMTFQRSFDSSSGPWLDVRQITASTPKPDTGANLKYDTTADRATAAALGKTIIYYRLGFTDGWVSGTHNAWLHSRIPRLHGWSTDGYIFGDNSAANLSRPNYWLNTNTQDYWANFVPDAAGDPWGSLDYHLPREWPRDEGSLMHSTGESNNPHMANDRLEYCSFDDCLFIVDRPYDCPVGSGGTGARQTWIDFWRLMPPPLGEEATGEWLWVHERIEDGTPTHDGAACMDNRVLTSWAGKSKYVHKLKSVYITDRSEVPVQVIRLKHWI